MTHDELVQRAVRWLAKSRRCYIVFSEGGYRGELPDAIGWIGRWSILVECKTSKSDFYRDRRKLSRLDGSGMGQERYYLTPPGLLKASMIPDGWGLMEAGRTRINYIIKLPRGGPRIDSNPLRSINEVGFLVNHWGQKPDATKDD